MIIQSLFVDGYKNLDNINITFDEKMNIFYGENAQGKTNLIEALWLCSGAKSFRGTKDKDFICFDKNAAKINVSFKDNIRQQNISVSISRDNIKEKNITLNGVKQKLLSNLFGNLKCVVFTPEDLELSKGAPSIRRSFIDLCIAQIRPGYQNTIIKYQLLLNQRNTLLKNINANLCGVSDLDVWDEQLATLGAYISVLRYNYTKKLELFSDKLYSKMTDKKEKLSLFYESSIFSSLENRLDYKTELFSEYLTKIKNSRRDDLKAGFSTVGIHRDNLVTMINNLPTREYGSQGQNRSVALVLKLAQAYILADEIKDYPCVLLDDVLSELDVLRQNFVMSSISDMQVFITCCDKIKTNINGKVFKIKNGKIEDF